MNEIFYICAQPATYYYAWQVDAMILSFQKVGSVDLNKVHIVSASGANGLQIDPAFKKVEEKWKLLGVKFDYYKDNRIQKRYISSIRPHILKKHWEKYPWLKSKQFLYHDCDIVLSKPINFIDNGPKIVPVSDTISYIGAKYIMQKEHNLLAEMCEIVGIDVEMVKNREKSSGGAQYYMKEGITYQFWDKVYKDSEKLFEDISKKVNLIKKEEPDWHEIQIWCADMWAVLWNLWKNGYETEVQDELDFCWGTQLQAKWEKHAIFHNAGVVKEESDMPFYKGKYQKVNPCNAPRPESKWASQNYYDLVVEAYQETHK